MKGNDQPNNKWQRSKAVTNVQGPIKPFHIGPTKNRHLSWKSYEGLGTFNPKSCFHTSNMLETLKILDFIGLSLKVIHVKKYIYIYMVSLFKLHIVSRTKLKMKMGAFLLFKFMETWLHFCIAKMSHTMEHFILLFLSLKTLAEKYK